MEADEKAIWIARRLLGFIALRELLHHPQYYLSIFKENMDFYVREFMVGYLSSVPTAKSSL
jgi:hypothetical protein